MATIRIDNGVILTLDPERRIIEAGSVVIEKDRILDVGKTQEIKGKYAADRVIDASRKLIIPGLINAHIHFYHHMHRGLTPEDLPSGQADHFNHEHFATIMESEHEIYGGHAILLEMLKHGTTTFFEAGSYHQDEVMDEIGKIGMRGWMGKRVFDVPILGHKWLMLSTEDCLSANEKFLQKYENKLHDGSRVKPCVVAVIAERCSDKLLVESKKMADRYGVPLHVHTAFRLEDVYDSEVRYGCRPVERLYRLGVLGPNLVLIHMLHVYDREIAMLKECETNVVHCPSPALRGACGVAFLARIPEMMNAGVNVALGTDTSNYRQDLISIMRLTALIWKDFRYDTKCITAEKVIEMVTLNAAKALGMEKEIGSIEKGKKADIAIFNMERPEWIPLLNVVHNLVYTASGDSVETVIVDGEIIMENRIVKTIDEKEILDRTQQLGEDIAKRSGVKPYSGPWKII